MNGTEAEPLDVAIVGAGVAGAYCAYRLSKERSDLRVAVFEAENRVGGRLWSYRWDAEDTTVELGGEAFATIHANVFRLARSELGLNVVEHAPFNRLVRLFLRDALISPDDMENRANFPGVDNKAADVKLRYFVGDDYFIGGKSNPFEVVTNLLLNLMSDEVRECFGDLYGAVDARLRELGSDPDCENRKPLTLEQAEEFVTSKIQHRVAALARAIERSDVRVSDFAARRLGGPRQPARDLGIWALIVEELGSEGYELFLDAGFQNSSARQFSLVEMGQALLLGGVMMMVMPNFWSIEGGYDRLPKTMMERAGEVGTQLNTGRRLIGISRDDRILTLRMMAGDVEETAHAKRVIFSAPIAGFDSGIALDGFDGDRTAKFADHRKGVAAIPAGKLFLVYPCPWWTSMTDTSGGSPLQGFASSNMPCRAVYYQGECRDGRGLMTGALSDGINSGFWTGFLSPSATEFPGPPPRDGQVFQVPSEMVDACHKMLAQMHGPAMPGPLPDPEAALYKAWRGVGGGWSAWKTGRNIRDAAAALRNPFEDGSLTCCGDSVSERHGWVEDTLESAEDMLRESFDLGPAPWLPAE